jgi:hypothetical protein
METKKTSREFFEQLNNIRKEAKSEIIALMEKHNATMADLSLDNNGKCPNDADYDQEDVEYNRVWLDEVYDNGYVRELHLKDGKLSMIVQCDGYEIKDNDVCVGTDICIALLERLEEMENHNTL